MTLDARLVEETVARHERVTGCAVATCAGESVAFFTLRDGAAPLDDERSAGKEKLWEMIFDEAYAKGSSNRDATLDSAGWTDTLTGRPIPEDEMARVVAGTVARVTALRPRRILEIGCGTGMLLFRLAPQCEAYVGTDVSGRALGGVRAQLAGRGRGHEWASRVRLEHRSALDLDGLDDGAFDVVLLNSTVQYFPSVRYLVEVVRRASRVVAPGGKVFLGDLRSLPLVPAFHAAAESNRCGEDEPVEAIRKRWKRSLSHERELVLDPAIGLALRRDVARVIDASVRVKRGRDRHELVPFRFDLTLTLDGGPADAKPPSPPWLDWREAGLTIDALRARLDAGERLAVDRVPNARLVGPHRALAWVEGAGPGATGRELRATRDAAPGDAAPGDAIDPEDLFAIGDDRDVAVDVGWSGSSPSGDVAAVITRGPGPGAPFSGLVTPPRHAALLPAERFANEPTKNASLVAIVSALDALVRGAAGADARVRYVHLAALPRTASGEVDRDVLAELSPVGG